MRGLLRAILGLVLLASALFAAAVAWRAWHMPGRAPAPPPASAPRASAPTASLPRPAATPGCPEAPEFAAAAAANAASLYTAPWQVFGRPESGWETYAPLIAQELGSACAPEASGFARALSVWQRAHGLAESGVVDEATLKAMNQQWLLRRPFVTANSHGECPPPPTSERLAWVAPAEGYSGKKLQLRATALAAYRRMVADARREVPEVAADPQLLSIFSGYRDPTEEAARCADGGCGTIEKARCSVHRTGLAIDLYLGAAPGQRPDSSADDNRAWMSRTPAYRWLVAHAGEYGFVPYPFEPWHWEWTGEPI